MQRSAQAVYDHIAVWADEPLTEATAPKVADGPWDHLVGFADAWPAPDGADLDSEIEPV